MKVKIGDKIYDANEQPIMIILTEEDKKNIGMMVDQATKYICFPDSCTTDEIDKFKKI